MKLVRLTDARLHTALRKLSAMPVPLRIAFKLKGIQARVDEELKKFEQVRLDALDKFGKKDAEGKVIMKPDGHVEFEPEQLKAFAAELNELGQMNIDMPSVKADELGDKVELSADELSVLDGIIVD